LFWMDSGDHYDNPNDNLVDDIRHSPFSFISTELPSVVTNTPATTPKNVSEDPMRGVAFKEDAKHVMVIYTGGTLGMKKVDGSYHPVQKHLVEMMKMMPELQSEKMPAYHILEYDPLLDSANMSVHDWIKIAQDIEKHYYDYDGFVVIHGTDTMAYTASALSFMFENLGKPVIFTGACTPLVEVVSDGRRNLIVSMLIAGYVDIPEVCVFFNQKVRLYGFFRSLPRRSRLSN